MGESDGGVRFRPRVQGDGLDELYTRALATGGRVDDALALARRLGATAPVPGGGDTAHLWQSLATIAAADVTAARVAEPHLDALAILHQARGVDLPTIAAGEHSTWGVFAAEGAGSRLAATRSGDGWCLSGTKPWCSLAGMLTHALVTATTSASRRRLFAVDLRHPGVRPGPDAWVARGLVAVPSGPVAFDEVPAVPVGDDGWYLDRPGFAWGGTGVAAVWWGAAAGIARRLLGAPRRSDRIAELLIGSVDLALHAGGLALAAAAAEIDSPHAEGGGERMLALRTRAIVARGAEDVLRLAGHALGPAPLALEDDHARRVADLTLYLRQHHAERDEADLGATLLDARERPW
ncbi:MAG: acyl-CoA dehydrogenase family protein [Burkholderiaceae bacterium]|nr:acyl-CoA dehydrogenase family protein [Microbacteriaceae bacterium]